MHLGMKHMFHVSNLRNHDAFFEHNKLYCQSDVVICHSDVVISLEPTLAAEAGKASPWR